MHFGPCDHSHCDRLLAESERRRNRLDNLLMLMHGVGQKNRAEMLRMRLEYLDAETSELRGKLRGPGTLGKPATAPATETAAPGEETESLVDKLEREIQREIQEASGIDDETAETAAPMPGTHRDW